MRATGKTGVRTGFWRPGRRSVLTGAAALALLGGRGLWGRVVRHRSGWVLHERDL
ncbi:hypothetical protein [Halovulum marinum]|uniref:hypothetical protein n=1 Tax=Halovulum marinum TaxID=2662447 RepID=UPI0012B3A44C|nr:hypothetical protein [Halovulum marinum]